MNAALALALFLAIGFAGARGWLGRATLVAGLFLSGLEFFFVGILLGPYFLGFLSDPTLVELEPVVYLALGWTGLLFGIQLSRREMERVGRRLFFASALDVLAMAVGTAVVLFIYLGPYPDNLVLAVFLGLVASITSPTMITALSRTLPARGPLTETAKLLTSLSPVFALILFGLFFSMVWSGDDGGVGGGLLRWLVANGAGVVLGGAMVLLTAQRCSPEERGLLIMGFVMMVGGLCYYFHLSPLYTAMVMGVVTANYSRRRDLIYQQLVQVEKTIYVTFLILLGGMVRLGGLDPLLPAVFIGVRLVLRSLLAPALGRILAGSFPVGLRTGLVMAGQGGMALALVLDYSRSGGLEGSASALVLAVVLNDVLGVYLTRQALRASGDAGGRPPAGDRRRKLMEGRR